MDRSCPFLKSDNHLLKYESSLRASENDLRRQARNELALEGRIATEGEIRRWRERRESTAAAAAAAAAPAPAADTTAATPAVGESLPSG